MSDPALANVQDTTPAPSTGFWGNLFDKAKGAVSGVGNAIQQGVQDIASIPADIRQKAQTARNAGEMDLAQNVPIVGGLATLAANALTGKPNASGYVGEKDAATQDAQNAADRAQMLRDLLAQKKALEGAQSQPTPPAVNVTSQPAQPGTPSPSSSATVQGGVPPSADVPPETAMHDIPSVDLEGLLKQATNTPLSAYGAHKGPLGGFLDAVQAFGKGLSGSTDPSMIQEARQRRADVVGNLMQINQAYKYNSAFNRMNQQFQAAINQTQNTQERNMLIQDYINQLNLLMPQARALAIQNPLTLQYMTDMFGPDVANAQLTKEGGAAYPQFNMAPGGSTKAGVSGIAK